MGLFAVQIAAVLGGKVIAVDVSEKALAAARELGAVHTINSRVDNSVEVIRTLTSRGAKFQSMPWGSRRPAAIQFFRFASWDDMCSSATRPAKRQATRRFLSM